jgi:hypothetical protein
MRKQDIKPGVIYAIQRSREYGSPDPVMFLNAPADGRLYRRDRHVSADAPAFSESPGSTPQRGSSWGPGPVGYPVARGRSSSAPDLALLASVTLADFKGARSAYREDGISFDVITSLAQITGPYAEMAAEHEAKRQADQEHRARQDAAADDRRIRSAAAAEKLAAAGIDSYSRDGEIALTLENAEKLAALIAPEDSP